MSALQLLLTPDANAKPWLNIYANSVTAKTVNATGSQTIASLEVKNNLTIGGYTNSSSDQYNAGLVSLATNLVGVITPSINGGNLSIYNRNLSKVVQSGVSGVNTAGASVNGGFNWSQLNTPFNNPLIEYSPDLNLYSGIDSSGSAVYTSPSANNGTWGIGIPYPGPGTFASNGLSYFPAFGRFYTGTSDPSSRIASSVNGSAYFPQASNRTVQQFAYAAASSNLGTGTGRLLAVGDSGPQYSDDGKTWVNSNSTLSMSDVEWSPFWKKFVGVPRGGTLNSIFSSVDGINWTTSIPGFDTQNLRTIVWSDQFQVFVIAGDQSRFWISKDGLNWKRLIYSFGGGAAAFYVGKFYPEIGNFMFCGISTFTAVSLQLFSA